MNRLLIPRIEGRILLGVVMFVSMMIIIGWVVINEPARMASFEEQHTGRSIERGAQLFNNNCTTCHGINGYGGGQGPALNSPHLFGVNFMADINSQILPLQREQQELQIEFDALTTALTTERDTLITEFTGLASDQTQEAADRRAFIQERLNRISPLVSAETDPDFVDQQVEQVREKAAGITDEIELAATNRELAELQTIQSSRRIAEIDEELAPLIEQRQQIIDSIEPAVIKGYLPLLEPMQAAEAAGTGFEGDDLITGIDITNYINADSQRLVQMDWAGSLPAYIKTTLIHGRPGSGNVWGNSGMAAWSQLAGGNLRDDQIDDLVNYIVNWDKGDDWTTADLLAVQGFGKIAEEYNALASADGPQQAGTDVAKILETVAGLEGDPVHGDAIYAANARTELNKNVNCATCHIGAVQGPATELKWDDAVNLVATEPQLAGYSPEQYLIESIVLPNAYIHAGYSSGVMPVNYSQLLGNQDIADILAYLRSFSE